MNSKGKYYLTTAIAYTSGKPHVGNTYEIVLADAIARYKRKDGYDVLDKLYDDNDLNCDNFAQAVREYRCSREVITAVANLYLRQQIMLDTY